jgi:hypothetical protein
MGYGLVAAGMGKQMGDESKPPIALTLRQVLWITAYLETQNGRLDKEFLNVAKLRPRR